MDSIINVGLIKNPLNWVIILLMIVLGYILGDVVFIKHFRK